MSDLAKILISIAAVCAVAGISLLTASERVKSLWQKLPGNLWVGRILAAAALAWAALLLKNMEMGFINAIKPYLWFMAAAVYILVAVYMKDLLSCRAAGGLALIIPGPLLDAARFYPSPENPSSMRLIAVSLAYIMIVKGILVVARPYTLRNNINWITSKPRRMRISGAICLILAIALTTLSLTLFRGPAV